MKETKKKFNLTDLFIINCCDCGNKDNDFIWKR